MPISRSKLINFTWHGKENAPQMRRAEMEGKKKVGREIKTTDGSIYLIWLTSIKIFGRKMCFKIKSPRTKIISSLGNPEISSF